MGESLQALPFTMGDGRYHVSTLIAQGGTARVYLAYDIKDRAWRAIKRLRPEYAMRTDTRRRLRAEAKALRLLEHPHILRVFESVVQGDDAYFVMERAERGSMGDWVHSYGAIPEPAALEVIRQVGEAVGHAHRSNIIHRDIKPHNILIDGRGTCLVADFGIASVQGSDRFTKTGSALGTLGFMAPEQFDSAKDVDERADIYSIAATLYALVLAKVPHDLFMHNPGDDEFGSVSPEVVQLICKGSRRRVGERHQTIEALLDDIERAQAALTPLTPEMLPLIVPPEAPAPPPLPSTFIDNSTGKGPPTFNLEGTPRTVEPTTSGS